MLYAIQDLKFKENIMERKILTADILMVIIMIIIALTFRAKGLEPYPPPDVPYPYDANLVDANAPVGDWMVVGSGSIWSYNLKIISKWGTDVNVTTSEPIVTVEFKEKTHHGGLPYTGQGYWQQVFNLLWSPFEEGLKYVHVYIEDRAGRRQDRTIVILVADDPPLFYPYDKPVVLSKITWPQQTIQVAKKQQRYPVYVYGNDPDGNLSICQILKIVHRWN